MASFDEKPNPRFAEVNDEVLTDLINASTSKNTKKQIKYAVSILAEYALSIGSSLDAIEKLDKSELDSVLQKFYAACRKSDGNMYQKKSMQGIKFGLQRHFQAIHRSWDIIKDREFAESNKVFKSVMVKLKTVGLGSVRHKQPISSNDFSKIRDSDACDPETPRGLQNVVFINLMLFLCNRGQENLRELKPADFLLETDTDDAGLRYITRRDFFTKNNREDSDEKVGGKMYELPGNARCPVKSFLLYTSKLNPLCPAFWQKPREVTPADPEQPWYCNSPVGNNTLSQKMKVISTSAGCSTTYTNHCLRATCVTVLDREGFANRDIMTVSGHHSETSIKHYSKTSEEKMRAMSNAIAVQSMPMPTTTAMPLQQEPNTSAEPPPRPNVTRHQPPVVPAVVHEAFRAQVATSSTSTVATAALPPALLTDSQESVLLQEIAVNNITEMMSSNQNQTFYLQGCSVHFHNSKN